MQCPHDQTTLQMTERQGIEIDYCPTCRGVWLDRGELDKIIERTSALAPEQSASSQPTPDPRPQAGGYPPAYPQPSAYGQYPARGRSPRSPDSPYEHHGRGYDPRHAPRKRKSFLDDLFDF